MAYKEQNVLLHFISKFDKKKQKRDKKETGNKLHYVVWHCCLSNYQLFLTSSNKYDYWMRKRTGRRNQTGTG